jgi:hypothetical protein
MSEQQRGVEREHGVRIHIDQKQYESPNPTTGEALYALGHVAADLEMYREVDGDREDRPIPNGPEMVHLKEDDHFHSGPHETYRIYVNGQEKTVTAKKLTYAEVVALAFPGAPTGDNIFYSVSYEDGPHANPVGSLAEGGKVKIKDGMIFNVTRTDRS